ncbi:MAG: hypothetical protein ACC628_04360 [Pirellulaceae bacterium]
MPGAALVKSVNRFNDVMNTIVDRWSSHMRQIRLPAKQPHEMLRSLILPPPKSSKSLANVDPVVVALSDRLQVCDNNDLRARVEQRIHRIAVDVAGSLDVVMQKLSDLAFEYAACRTLISPQDRFHVSPFGVLAAAALANVQMAAELLRQHPGRAINAETVERVMQPLDLAAAGEVELAPGDLWLLDLFARTVRLTSRGLHRQATQSRQQGAPAEESILGGIVPRFTSISMLHKLIEADDLAPWLAKKSRYSTWPGLETFVASPAAAALRNLVVGESTHHVVNDRVGLARGAFIRFLDALLALEQPVPRLKARVLIATLLWETLEQDDKLLLALIQDKRYAKTVQAAVSGIEASRRGNQEGPAENDRHRLNEICSCLETYDQYNALVSLQSPKQRLRSPAAALPT